MSNARPNSYGVGDNQLILLFVRDYHWSHSPVPPGLERTAAPSSF
jgi:hypothetical protein